MSLATKPRRSALLRRLIVYPKLQITFLLLTGMFGLVCAFGTFALLQLTEAPNFIVNSVILGGCLFLVGVALLILNLIFLNRILGPIYRLNKEIEEALSKKLAMKLPFKTRKNDLLNDFATNLTLLLAENDRQPSKVDEV